MSVDPAIAFQADEPDEPAVRVRVNFGLLTGRTVTQAEIDDLARAVHPIAPSFVIVSEERHAFGEGEAAVHQVLVEIPSGSAADEVVAVAERWARACFEARHSDLTEL